MLIYCNDKISKVRRYFVTETSASLGT